MSQNLPKLERLAQANLPTRWGDFLLVVFHWRDPLAHPGLSQEHVALIRGEVQNERAVPVRIHSECLTGETFGSLRCDCSDQLKTAQQFIANAGVGVILYLRQEGRGIGLTNKIKAYALQEEGFDTIDANLKLHLPIDARQYDVAGAILHHLGVSSIRLLTNNPDKVAGITKAGIEVEERIPNWIPANQHSAAYLEVKKERMRHEIPSDALASVLPETKPNGGS